MKSGQQKKSLDRFIYESMGEKQYLGTSAQRVGDVL